jgi:hypothetical protein
MVLRGFLLAGAMVFGIIGPASARGAEAQRPVVIELFTSEGCSSCPPADADLARIVSKQPIESANIIALAWHIDYWDKLGWKDPFSSQQATARQYEYGRQFRLSSVYTPQLVVDGAVELIGGEKQAADDAITQAAKSEKTELVLKIEPGDDPLAGRVHVTIPKLPALAKGDSAELLIAVTEDDLVSHPNRGENARRTLEHTAVVRTAQFVVDVSAGRADVPLAISPDWNRSKLHIVAVLQSQQSRQVLGAARVSLPASDPAARPAKIDGAK